MALSAGGVEKENGAKMEYDIGQGKGLVAAKASRPTFRACVLELCVLIFLLHGFSLADMATQRELLHPNSGFAAMAATS
jgi:hypothetical protein